MKVETAARVDRGRRRRRNEDRALAIGSNGFQDGPQFLLAVADGMGGAPGGSLASQLAIDTLASRFPPGVEGPDQWLRSAFATANVTVGAAAATGLPGMGTTLVAALIRRGRLWVANVGDSRAYLLRDSRLRQLSADHSWVAERVAAGQMTVAQASTSPRRNIITRSLGTSHEVETDVFSVGDLAPGDVLLLCSDGLYTMLDEGQIASVLTRAGPPAAASELVVLANDAGGKDNIAVVVARVSE